MRHLLPAAALLLATSAALSERVSADELLAEMPAEEARQVLQWGADWVRHLIPETYHNDKSWGKTKRIVSGLDIKTSDGRLHTNRRRRDVEHGRWVRYEVRLGDPTDPRRLNIQVLKAEQGADRRLRFEVQIDTLVDVHFQQQRWNLGVKLLSLSVDAEARIRMRVTGDIAFEMDLTRIPPDILADPHVLSTQLELVDLKVDRIGVVGGDAAESIGDLVKRVVRDEYLPEQQAKITDKLNRQIDRRRDRLRLSASEWFSRTLGNFPAVDQGRVSTETQVNPPSGSSGADGSPSRGSPDVGSDGNRTGVGRRGN